jgi:hypothetical protein
MKPIHKKRISKLAAALLFSLGGLQACYETNALEGAPSSATPPVNSGETPLPSTLYQGDTGFEDYVLKFLEDSWAQGVDMVPELTNPPLEIRLASLDSYGSSVIGLCQTGSNTRRVTFDPDFWNRVSETQREQLAHHELGHCMLYRGHRSTFLDSGLPASLMYPSIFSSSTYTNNFGQAMVDELDEMMSPDQVDTIAADRDTPRVHICDPTSEPTSEPNRAQSADGV